MGARSSAMHKLLFIFIFLFELSSGLAIEITELHYDDFQTGQKLRVGHFFGTFDPPHLYHEELMTSIIDALDLDYLIIVPSELPLGKPLASYIKKRLDMLYLVFADHEKIIIPYTWPFSSYPISTQAMRYFSQRTDKVEHIGIMGMDSGAFRNKYAVMFYGLKKWALINDTPFSEVEKLGSFVKKVEVVRLKINTKDTHSKHIRSYMRTENPKIYPGPDVLPIREKVFYYIKETGLYTKRDGIKNAMYRCLIHLMNAAKILK